MSGPKIINTIQLTPKSYEILDQNGKWVATINSSYTSEEVLMLATLFAAAPTLLRAARVVKILIDQPIDKKYKEQVIDRALTILNQAINRAEGRD